MATIKEVSRLANVSTASVSKVINGDYSGVSEATKERILWAAKELKYRPNRLARGLVKSRTTIAGLLVPDISNPYFAELAKGLEEEAEQNGYNLILCNTADNPKKERKYIHMLVEYNADGVVLCGMESYDKTGVEMLTEREIPFVSIDRDADVSAPVSFYSNSMLGAMLATERLMACGHREIAFIGGEKVPEGRNKRYAGFLAAMASRNLSPDDNLIRFGPYNTQTGYERATELLRGSKKFTAIVCANDLIALGAVKAIREKGLDVPKDISLTGYDDILLSSLFEPKLTTIRQDSYTLGREVFKELLGVILGERKEKIVRTFEPELVLRESVRNIGQ
ncbi:MAG: LacI family transcriptional regulator [Clostridiales bacterium]|nr:LacI family transcriptional regulator [Clostridiales bacterium]